MAKWLDIDNYREYIETSVINRLSKYGPVTVPPQLMETLWQLVKPYTSYLSRTYRIDGFSPEDIESYLFMKMYQMLTHGKHNPSKGSQQIFLQAFRNLLTDIKRMSERIEKIGLVAGIELEILPPNAENHELVDQKQPSGSREDFFNIIADSLENGEEVFKPLIEPLLSELDVLHSRLCLKPTVQPEQSSTMVPSLPLLTTKTPKLQLITIVSESSGTSLSSVSGKVN